VESRLPADPVSHHLQAAGVVESAQHLFVAGVDDLAQVPLLVVVVLHLHAGNPHWGTQGELVAQLTLALQAAQLVVEELGESRALAVLRSRLLTPHCVVGVGLARRVVGPEGAVVADVFEFPGGVVDVRRAVLRGVRGRHAPLKMELAGARVPRYFGRLRNEVAHQVVRMERLSSIGMLDAAQPVERVVEVLPFLAVCIAPGLALAVGPPGIFLEAVVRVGHLHQFVGVVIGVRG
jgi:hypothetical protein